MRPGVDLPVPERALAIGAHSDDVEFGCGATLAKWATAGTEVHLCVLTDGSKGTWDGEADTASLVKRRVEEQHDAARVLGVSEVHFLHAVDGELATGPGERARVCELIRAVRPDVVLSHDPWKRYRLHPDHRNAGTLAIDAIVAARDPHFFPEQPFAPHRPDVLLLFEAEDVDHLEQISTTFDTKVEALLCHRSQWRSTMGIHDRPDDQREAFERRLRESAHAAGLRAGIGLAEAFKRIDDL